MKRKTLTKMRIYCRLKGLRFGQLIANLARQISQDTDPFFIEDFELTREFNKLLLKDKPVKKRAHFYKKPVSPS